MRVLTRHKHNSAIGKDSHLLDSNINPLKDWPGPEKEFAIDEIADLKLCTNALVKLEVELDNFILDDGIDEVNN